jgi:hypothetical protein
VSQLLPGWQNTFERDREDCDEGLARQDSGWLSVSGLGAVSAESYGRDSFVQNLLVLGSRGLICLLRLTVDQTE